MLIYVAGPYSAVLPGDRLLNVERALEAGKALIDCGHWPVIPHLSHFYDEWRNRITGSYEEPEMYMQWDFALLRRCDALLYLASSPGADRELALAWELGLPVYRSLFAVPRETA